MRHQGELRRGKRFVCEFEGSVVFGAFAPEFVESRGGDVIDGFDFVCFREPDVESIFVLTRGAEIDAGANFGVKFGRSVTLFEECLDGAAPSAQ